MLTLEEAIKHAEYIVNNRKDAISVCWSVKDCKQFAEWFRELQERRKADSCEGCVKEFGKSYLLVCTSCKRNYADLYEPERKTE